MVAVHVVLQHLRANESLAGYLRCILCCFAVSSSTARCLGPLANVNSDFFALQSKNAEETTLGMTERMLHLDFEVVHQIHNKFNLDRVSKTLRQKQIANFGPSTMSRVAIGDSAI
jgi:hypothetical protein